MNTLSFTGVLHRIGDLQKISDRFEKKEFIVMQSGEGQYGPWTNTAKFQLIQQHIPIIDPFKVGDTVEVSFDIKGRLVSKDGVETCYTNLDCWKIEPAGEAKKPEPEPEQAQDSTGPIEPTKPASSFEGENEGTGDLPF